MFQFIQVTATYLMDPAGIPVGAAVFLSVFFLLLVSILTAFDKACRILPQGKLEQQSASGDRKAKSLLRRMSDSKRFFRQLVFTKLLYGASFFMWTDQVTIPLIFPFKGNSSFISFLVGVLIALSITLIFYVFAIELPGRVAGGKEGQFARSSGYLIMILMAPAYLLECVAHLFASVLLRLTHIREVEDASVAPTEEEFLQMLEAGHAKGAIEDDNRELIQNLFEFDDKIAAEVMTHRTEVEALPVEASLEETMSFLYSTKYTRFPIYDGSVDNIIGVLHAKDLLFYHDQSAEEGQFELTRIMRPAWFTPETRNISDLFREMQQNHIQMAIVIDEYGGTAGLLTIEDLVEQILGNIEDEYDEAEQEMIEIAPDTWLVEGSFSVDQLSKVTGVHLGDDEYDTVAGLVIELLDRIPEEHERPTVQYGELRFHVLAISDNRIVRLRVTKEGAEDKSDESVE